MILILVISVFAFSSCKKEVYPEKLSGVVIDGTTSKPIESVKVAIYMTETDGDLFYSSNNQKLLSVVETNENGKFELPIEVTNSKKATYFWKPGKEGYYPLGGAAIKPVKKRLFKNANEYFIADTAKMYKYAFVKIIVRNLFPYDDKDEIWINLDKLYVFKGGRNFIDSTNSKKWDLGETNKFYWENFGYTVFKNNVSKVKFISFNCIPGNINRIYIDY